VSTATFSHTIPATEAEWLAGWRISKAGNPFRQIGADFYTVCPSKFGGFYARIGKGAAPGTWPDITDAKRGLYEVVVHLDPVDLAAMHDGTYMPSSQSRELARPAPGSVTGSAVARPAKRTEAGDGPPVLARKPRFNS
jgi:hypothetical protein